MHWLYLLLAGLLEVVWAIGLKCSDGLSVRTREQLLNTVWGDQFEGYARTVGSHMRRLRTRLGESAALVETVCGVGYRFRQ